MTNLRNALAALVIGLLTLGWLGSSWASMNGRAPEWAQKVDQAPIRILALAILVLALVIAFVPERESAE